MSDDANALPQWAVRRPRTISVDPPMGDLLGIENVTSTEKNPETSVTKDDTSNDEHIARLEQQIADLQGEVERVRNFGKLPISNTPLQEPKTTAPIPPHFPSLESPVPNHFPPQNIQPISTPVANSHSINLPPTTQANSNPQYVNPSLICQNPSNQIPSNTHHVTSPQVQVPTNPPHGTSFPVYQSPPTQIPFYPQYTTPSLAFQNPQNQVPTNLLHAIPTIAPYNTLRTQNHSSLQHTSAVHVDPSNMQCVPPIYVTEAQPSTTLAPNVDQYDLLEKEWKMKLEERDKEMRELREEVRNMRFFKRGEKLEYEDLCVHPDIDLPEGYKPPKFEMFDGTGNPLNHLRSYCDKLIGVGRNEAIRMKLFIRSLTGDALTWYIEQDPKTWRNWSSMAEDFMERFRFNIEIVPDRSYLEKLKKKTTETFREYAIRWRSEAARVRPPVDESEMKDIFIKAQDNMYYERMLLMTGAKFTDLVKIGEALEEGIKSGRVTNFAALQEANKALQFGTIGGVKKKKEEVAAVMNVQGRGQGPIHAYHSQPIQSPDHQMFSPVSYPVYNTQPMYYQQPPTHQNPPHYQQPSRYQPPNNPATPPRPRQNLDKRKTYTPLAESYGQLFERLKTAGLIQPIFWRDIEPRPKWFDESKHCAYHSGAAGHDTENCFALKDKIELLIKENVIQLKGASPNVNNNPLPNHGDIGVNMITVDDELSLKGTITPAKENALEVDPVKGIRNLFATEEGIGDFIETPTIWDDLPGYALKNWTCAPSLVRRES